MDAFVIRSPVPLPQPVSVARNTPTSTKKPSPAKITEDQSCIFCGRETDNEDQYGKKLYYSGGYTHYFCMLFASGLVQQGPENKGCCGFMPYHLNKELRRGKNIICVFCEKGGATIGCCNKKCKNQWHFPCGLENGALNQYYDNFNSYCEEHRPRQNLHLYGDLDRMCTICVSEVHGEVDSNDALRTPCCAKNTLYHRSCLQRYALSSALHHFKCPLCNNVKEFQKEMQKLGIYIPDQDAAWELEPNAFHELLERYDSCDKDNCLCPEGRKYNNKRSKQWAIALCDVCGSSGVHLKCGGLKSSKNEWICPECAVICPPSPEIRKKKKTDIMSYEDWCENRFGRKRAAAFEHDTPSKRRKRDIADYRTPRYVEVSLCITGHCNNVPTHLLQVKPKRQYKKGVVRSLNLTGTVSSPAHRLGNWLKQANEIPKQSIKCSDTSSMRKYFNFMTGENVGSTISNGVIVKPQTMTDDLDVCVIDDSDEDCDVPAKPTQRPVFSIFRSIPEPATPCSSQKIESNASPGPSHNTWNTQAVNDTPKASCSEPSTTWSFPFVSDQEKENNRIKLREKLATFAYDNKTKDNCDTVEFLPTGVEGVTFKSVCKRVTHQPKEDDHNTPSRRHVSVLGDATRITINAKDYAPEFGRKDDSTEKYRFQVPNLVPVLKTNPFIRVSRTNTDYPDYHLFGDLDSDYSDSESDVFPISFSIDVKNLAVDLSKQPDRKQMNGGIKDTDDREMDPFKAYQAYKNSHRNVTVRSPGGSSLDTLSVGCEVEAMPRVGNVSYASQNKPSTSGTDKRSPSKAKPEEFEVVLISDDDDEEPFLDLTSTPDDVPEEPERPVLPLVCDLTEDGNYDIFINPGVGGRASATMPGSIGPQKKVQEWLEAGQGEPNKRAQNSEFVTRIVPQPGPQGQVATTSNTAHQNSVLAGNMKVRTDVPVAKVLPMTQSTAGTSAASSGVPPNRNPHLRCTCHLGRAHPPKAPAHPQQQQVNPSMKQPTSSAGGNVNVRQHPKPAVDDTVIILDD